MEYAIIGGTGVYDPKLLSDVGSREVETPYGTIVVDTGTYEGVEVAFLPRHGKDHSVPPHKINYRANIWGLKALGVKRILATAAVGSINEAMQPGHFVIIDQFLDFTKSRVLTFFDDGDRGVVHVDVTEPYCPVIRAALIEVGRGLGITLHPTGTYVCVEGPRYESAAEIRAFRILGGDVVGMTNIPEAVLAREIGICYATMAMVTNMGAGMAKQPLSHDEVVEIMAVNTENVRRLALDTILRLAEEERQAVVSDEKHPAAGDRQRTADSDGKRASASDTTGTTSDGGRRTVGREVEQAVIGVAKLIDAGGESPIGAHDGQRDEAHESVRCSCGSNAVLWERMQK